MTIRMPRARGAVRRELVFAISLLVADDDDPAAALSILCDLAGICRCGSAHCDGCREEAKSRRLAPPPTGEPERHAASG